MELEWLRKKGLEIKRNRKGEDEKKRKLKMTYGKEERLLGLALDI